VSDGTPFAQKGEDHLSLILSSDTLNLWERLESRVCRFARWSQQLERLPGFVTAVLTEVSPISSSSAETVGRGVTAPNPHNHHLNPAPTPED